MTRSSAAAAMLAFTALAHGGAAWAAKPADMIIRNATMLTIDAERHVYEKGVVVIREGRIAAVGGADLAAEYKAPTVIDAGGDIVMPGMINGHNHLSMSAFRGVRSSNPNPTLFNFFFPLEKAMLSRDLIRVAARQAAIESAMGGVTMVTDAYYHEDEVAKAVAQVGIRGVLGEGVINFPVVDSKEPYGGLEYARTFIKAWKGHELITPAVAPHAPYTLTAEWLLKCRDLAAREGVPILMHIAEIPQEEALIENNLKVSLNGKSVIKYLDSIGFLTDNLVAAHVIHVDDEDMAILKRHGVGISHNPKSNLFGENGFSPAWKMFEMGMDVGLGTDGPVGISKMEILDVMGYATAVARSFDREATRVKPFELVYMATMGGAKALDKEAEIGSLEVGKKADIIIIDVDTPNMQPRFDPYYQVAVSAYPSNVLTTIVGGKFVMRDRVIQNVDMDQHYAEWAPIVQKVQDFGLEL
ncbi:MAG: amidohydrolase [Hyphomicrobiales bacterium]|nr:MAG: amidohydrolase [Hyphomicrobiales bacterium]